MPCAEAARPRKMLPPPMTSAISTPSARTSAISEAMRSMTPGSMPKPVSPMRASPESLSRMRLKRGAGSPMEMGEYGIDAAESRPVLLTKSVHSSVAVGGEVDRVAAHGEAGDFERAGGEDREVAAV